LHKRLDCKCSSRGSIYIHKEGIDNEIRKEQLTESATARVSGRVGERVKVSESLSEVKGRLGRAPVVGYIKCHQYIITAPGVLNACLRV
jgi:hypothetical protein